MISIIFSTREENPEYLDHLKKSCGIKGHEILQYVNTGDKSLSQVYNQGLKESKNDIVVFLHDDLELPNAWGKKLKKHFDKNPEYGILGIAGTTDLIDGMWWTIKESMTGIVNHKSEGKTWTSKYSKDQNHKVKEVVVLDGLFFGVKKSELKANFDESFEGFHFYDIPFFFANYLEDVKLGVVTNIRVTHLSVGQTNEQWEENKTKFEELYGENLPARLTNNKTFDEKLKFDPDTVGFGMVTYNAEDRIRQSAFTVPSWIKNFVIVNDGTPYPEDAYPESAHIIQHEKNECVGKAKSNAIQYLMDKGCEHIFIMEDDILIKDEKVFEEYIKHSLITGIKHLNFGLHGPANKKGAQSFSNLEERAQQQTSEEPNPRMVVKYDDDINIALYPNCVGAFSYYRRDVIEKIGVFDPKFKNAWEHVDHTYETIKKGYHPSFWYFADIQGSWDYLTDIPNSIENSTIARSPTWERNYKVGMEHYKKKHGMYPTQTPIMKPEMVQQQLQMLYQRR